jgi:hypothetical protein
MQPLIAFLQSIPDVIWSGVIASVLTLSGVLISNRSNTTRLQLQQEHDAAEKSKERTATLRREVCLKTAEELVKANAYLAGLPQLDLSKANVGDGLQGLLAAAARLQLVAEPKTALLVGQLSATYGELVLKLMIQLMPVGKAKADIEIADGLYTKAQTEVARILSEMAKQNESGHPDPRVFQVLNTSFDSQQAQARKYADDRNEAWTRFNANNLVFQRYLLQEMREIGAQQVPVLVEIRRDLGINSLSSSTAPNPSIERTLSGLRPPSASHVKR